MASLSRRLAPSLLFLVLPFALFSWALPFASFAQTLGKDYPRFTPSAQMNFMWAVSRGTLPVYMPGFSHGHSTAAMTLGQLYHPNTWLASLMPGYWHGAALEWETTFRLLSLGIAHLALFWLLRRLRVSPVVAFLATFPAVYNLRMLDSFRYGASLENYVGMLLVLASAGFVFVERRSWRAVAALAVSTYLLTVGGHPQWAFLGLVAAGVFALAAPWVLASLSWARPEITPARVLSYLARVTLGIGSGLLLAAPYLLPFYVEFMRNNAARADRDYSFTLEYIDSTPGALVNFLYPHHADVHGAFGGSALVLVVALLPALVVVARVPRAILALWLLAALGVLFALGDVTPVHAFFVQHVPFFSSFRVPGRAVLWVIPVIFPALAWMGRARTGKPLLVLGALGAAVVVAGALARSALLPLAETYSPARILKLGASVGVLDAVVAGLALATVVLLMLAGALRERRVALIVGAVGVAIVSTWVCFATGTWKAPKTSSTTAATLAARWRSSPYAHTDPGFGMEARSVTAFARAKVPVPRVFGSVAHDLAPSVSDEATLAAVAEDPNRDPLGERLQGRVFLDDTTAFAAATPGPADDTVDLSYNTTNRFLFKVRAERAGAFVLGVPWLPGFRATVDGHEVAVTRADAIFPAVPVKAGAHRIEFRFVSWSFELGVGIALVTALVWASAALRLRPWVAVLAGAIVLGGAGVELNRWLYGGPSFRTSYHWASEEAGS